MRRTPSICRVTRVAFLVLAALLAVPHLFAQTAAPTPASGPIAIVPLNSEGPDSAATVTGALEVTHGKAIIAASGTVTSGKQTTVVELPRRGLLRVCASSSVNLAADTSVPAGDLPGLMMAMDHGALELSFAPSLARARNADFVLTPDFRILIGGASAADIKVRLGPHGDTCVDNAIAPASAAQPGVNAAGPYVLVTSIFDSGNYRVEPGQRVMFEHGSLASVVDNEQEPCGCPPAAPKGNEFPLAQSEGLAPLAKPSAGVPAPSSLPQTALVYKSADHAPQAAAPPTAPATATATSTAAPQAKKKPGLFSKIGKFFRRIFGAE